MFTQRYESLLAHYGVEGRRIQVSKPNENGDVEQRHYRLKEAVDQTLMLRGSRDFESREDYEKFLEKLTSRPVTPSGSPRRALSRPSAAEATLTITLWPNPSSASTKPR